MYIKNIRRQNICQPLPYHTLHGGKQHSTFKQAVSQTDKQTMASRNLTTAIAKAARSFSSTCSAWAMKPGTPIAGLNFIKNAEPVVSKERSEYPKWVNNLTTPGTTLAKLRKMDMWSAHEDDQKRFLKLTRRIKIKEDNVDASLR